MRKRASLSMLLLAAGALAVASAAGPQGVRLAPRRVTFSPENESWPVWDPAGDRIAYLIGSANRGFLSAGSGGDIGLVTADGSSEMVAASGPDNTPFGFAIAPSWVGGSGRLMVGEKVDLHEYLSFDVSQAPFVREVREGGDQAFTLRLVAVPQAGGGALGTGDGVTVSRDGSTMAWRISRRGSCGPTQIRVAPLAGLSGQLAHEAGTVVLEGECEFPERPLYVDGFALTPDGSQLVVSLPPEPGTDGFPPLDLQLYRTDGGGLVRSLTRSGVEEGVKNRYPEVSPDGTQVVFNRGDAIYSVGLDGSGLTRLADRGLEPSWSPDGRRIAFSDLSPEDDPPNINIFVLTLRGEPGPFVPPGPDLDTLRDAFVDSDFNDVPDPGVDTRLIFERQGNVIRLFEADSPGRVWVVVCGNPHPLTGRPQSCVVDPPELPAPSSFWHRLKRAFLRDVMGIDARRHIVSIGSFNSALRAQSLVIESEIAGQDVEMTTITALDEDQDGVTDSLQTGGFLFLPTFQLDPLLVDVTGDGNSDYAGWPITIEGGRYFVPLADSNGDGVPDTTLFDFDRDGRLDPDVPLIGEFLTGPPPGPAQLRLRFAQFGDGEAGESSVFSQIALFNPDATQPVEAEIVLRDDDGKPLAVDLNGQPSAGSLSVQVPAGGLRLLRTDGLGEIRAGSAVVSSNRALAGNVLFGGTTGVAGVGVSQTMSGGFSAAVQTNQAQGIDTGLAVFNLEDASTPVSFRLLDSDGAPLAESEIQPLAAGGHRALFVTELAWRTETGEPIDFSDFRGILEGRSQGRLGATVLQTRPGELATLPVAPLAEPRGQAAELKSGGLPETQGVAGDLFQKLYFAQFGDGEQRDATGQVSASLFSEIVLLNLSSRQAAVRVLLRDDAGGPLTVDLNGQPATGQLDLVMPAGALRVLRSDGAGDLVAGSVVVCSDRQLAGTILFGGSEGTAGVGASSLLRGGFLAPVESRADRSLRTGFAVMNLSGEALPLDIRVRDAAGENLAATQIEVPPFGHTARFIDEFHEVLRTTDVEGVLEVTGSGKYAATVLRTSDGVFATQPVVPTLR